MLNGKRIKRDSEYKITTRLTGQRQQHMLLDRQGREICREIKLGLESRLRVSKVRKAPLHLRYWLAHGTAQ
jgi:hypothetical protein